MQRVLITTVPFADKDQAPIRLLEEAGIQYVINPIGRKLNEFELIEMIKDFDVLIAGTESITESVIANAPKLKFISRVGIGLDSVDLLAARRRGINVSYTPDAPAPAVAELTIGVIFSLLRHIQIANTQLHAGNWNRYLGRRISEVTFGIIGVGRIGRRVVDHLLALGAKRILINDVMPVMFDSKPLGVIQVEKEVIYGEADVISIHVPLSEGTRNLISSDQLKLMKKDAALINTARGGVINENDLFQALDEGRLSGAGIDVFEQEPYAGNLTKISRCILTSHMGSMSEDCRIRMEVEATEEAIRFINGASLINPVPDREYQIQSQERS